MRAGGVRSGLELSKISCRMSEGEESWCEGKCGSERVSFVGGVLGFDSEWQVECRQLKRISSFVGRGEGSRLKRVGGRRGGRGAMLASW